MGCRVVTSSSKSVECQFVYYIINILELFQHLISDTSYNPAGLQTSASNQCSSGNIYLVNKKVSLTKKYQNHDTCHKNYQHDPSKTKLSTCKRERNNPYLQKKEKKIPRQLDVFMIRAQRHIRTKAHKALTKFYRSVIASRAGETNE